MKISNLLRSKRVWGVTIVWAVVVLMVLVSYMCRQANIVDQESQNEIEAHLRAMPEKGIQ